MNQLEGRETSFKQKLRETLVKRNEHFGKTNCLIKKLDQDGTNIELKQHIAMLHLQVGLSIVSFCYILFFNSEHREEMMTGMDLE
jgi:hypothetical protein